MRSNKEGKGDWSDDGIKIHSEITDQETIDQVLCSSDHLTSFIAFATTESNVSLYINVEYHVRTLV